MKRVRKLSEIGSIGFIVIVLIGLGGLIWGMANSNQPSSFTGQANTLSVRATRQAMTETAIVQSTQSARQTRRAETAAANNSIIVATEEPTILTEDVATPTRDPRTPTIGAATPEPTGVVIKETRTPWPSATSLPTLPAVKRQGLWVENLVFGEGHVLTDAVVNVAVNVAFSPDGSQLAVTGFTGKTFEDKATGRTFLLTQVVVINLESSEVIPLGGGINPVWSPDGKYIAALAPGETGEGGIVRILDVINRESVEVIQLDKDTPTSQYIWLSPSDLAINKEGQPQVFDLNTGASRPLFDAGVLSQTDLEFPLRLFTGAQSKSTFAVGSSKEILIFQWSNGAAQLLSRIPEGLDHGYWAMSPDGEWIAYVPWSGSQVKIISGSDLNRRVELPESASGRPFVQSWSPDSVSLLYVDYDGVEIVNQDGSGLKTLPIESQWPPVWSPKGNQIVWVGADSRLYTSSVTVQ